MKELSKKNMAALEKYCAPQTIDVALKLDDDEIVTIQCKDYLTYDEIVGIAESVAGIVIGGGMYMPGAYDLAIARYIIGELTNIPLPLTDNGDVDLNKCYDLYMRLKLRDAMTKTSSKLQTVIWNIEDYANQQIDFMIRHAVVKVPEEKEPESDLLIDSFANILKVFTKDKNLQESLPALLDYYANKQETHSASEE